MVRGTLTMTTRSAARDDAIDRLRREWMSYYLVNRRFGVRGPGNEIIERIWKKQRILMSIDNILGVNDKDHLFFRAGDIKESYSFECIQAVCDGKDNMFSREHPLLSAYIRDNYDKELVTVELQTYLAPVPDVWGKHDWYRDNKRLFVNGRRVRLVDANRIFMTIRHDITNQFGRVVKARLKDGTIRNRKHWSLTALRLSPKKRTK
jgi:hypothetical protein